VFENKKQDPEFRTQERKKLFQVSGLKFQLSEEVPVGLKPET
jgi:hypothetical protein